MNKLSELQTIGKFDVTDRGLDDVMNVFGLDLKQVDSIRKDSVILNVGSGLYQEFEKELSNRRKDLKIFSVDPSLGVVTYDKDGNYTTQGFRIDDHKVDQWANYFYEGENRQIFSGGIKRGAKAVEFDLNRKREVAGNTVASLATSLAIGTKTVDIVFDCSGPIQYLKSNADKEKYLSEIDRVLKSDGVMFASSLDVIERSILIRLGFSFERTKSKDGSYLIWKNLTPENIKLTNNSNLI